MWMRHAVVRLSSSHSVSLIFVEFYIGQIYNTTRTTANGVIAGDPIETVTTTEGYLSNGNMHPIAIHSGRGDDYFDLSRNRNLLHLNSEAGDDTVIIRSFQYLSNSYAPSDHPDYVINSHVDVDAGTFTNDK